MLHTEILVKNALASTLNFSDIASIHNNHHLRNDLHLDSMGSLMFLMRLEETISGFCVDPETLQLKDLETVSSVVHYIDMQVSSKDDYVH